MRGAVKVQENPNGYIVVNILENCIKFYILVLYFVVVHKEV